MQLETALGFCGGAATPRRLREIGVPERELRTARDRGLLVGRGALALPDTPPSLIAAVRFGGVASHSTAATLHSFRSWSDDPALHVTVAGGDRTATPGVRLHRARLGRQDVDPFRPVTSPLRTVLDCARTMPLVDAVVVVDGALHVRRVRREPLRAAAAAARGPGAAALRQVVAFADALAESPLETVLRLVADILSCAVRTQVLIPGIGRMDTVLDGWLVLEGDGYEFHSGRREFRRDREWGNALAERGYVLLRFTYEDLRSRPGVVLAQVARVLAAGPPWNRDGVRLP